MRLASPALLWLLVVLPLLMGVAWWLADRARGRALRRFAEPRTLALVMRGAGGLRARLLRGLRLVAMLCLALALARPQWGETEQTVRRSGVDLMFLVDVSRSMLAEDLKPNRLSRARRFVEELAGALIGHRLGLAVFAGSAHVLCPLTLDDRAVLLFLEAVDPTNVTRLGTGIGQGLEVAAEAFPEGPGDARRVIVLLSDGEDHGDSLVGGARKLSEAGIVLHAIGFGTANGEPIPERDEAGRLTGHKKDAAGKVVLSRLRADELAHAAASTGGLFVDALEAEAAVVRIAEAVESLEKRELEALLGVRRTERFQIFLAIGLIALTLELLLPQLVGTRRGAAAREPAPAAARRST